VLKQMMMMMMVDMSISQHSFFPVKWLKKNDRHAVLLSSICEHEID
jgi:hypothetical protein